MKSHHNQRNFIRSTLSATAILCMEGQEAINVEVVDLSMSGVFIHCDLTPQVGAACTINILLGHIEHEIPIIAEGAVVRTAQEGVAIRFSQVKLESTRAIRHLIIEHAEEPDKAKEEFSRAGFWMFESEV